MNDIKLEHMVTQALGTNPIAAMTALLVAASRNKAPLTPDEVEALERKRQLRELASLEQMRQSSIYRHICPSCEGKLMRGKKDKKRGYKRAFSCTLCEEVHYV